jgi:NADH-quinone oxidoreductase subunit M
VLVAAFTLRALKRSFFDSDASNANQSQSPLEPITIPEKLGAGLLMFAMVAVGLYPKMLLDRIQPAVEAMRFLK